MSINTIYYPQGTAAVGVAGSTTTIASSSFLQNYGGAVGGFFSIAWIAISIFIIIMTLKMESGDTNSEYKMFIYLSAIVVILGTFYNNYIYFKSTDSKEDANSTYANISLIPIYLSLLVLAGMILSIR